jgi:hypothetical protein
LCDLRHIDRGRLLVLQRREPVAEELFAPVDRCLSEVRAVEAGGAGRGDARQTDARRRDARGREGLAVALGVARAEVAAVLADGAEARGVPASGEPGVELRDGGVGEQGERDVVVVFARAEDLLDAEPAGRRAAVPRAAG